MPTYWRYEVCVGGQARQWHELFGVRKVEHHLGSYEAETPPTRRQRYTRGHQGRFAILSVACPPAAPSASYETLAVREPQPHHYVMTLHHAAACDEEVSAEPFESLWGECFATNVLSA